MSAGPPEASPGNGRRHALQAMALTVSSTLLGPRAMAQSNGGVRGREVVPRGSLGEDERRNVEIFRRLSPSVVHINTVRFRRELFSTRVTEVPRGSGTGFVWDAQGHVVTNYHVLANANAAKVTLADQSVWDARLVGWFPDRDLAVLRVDVPPDRLVPIPVGTSRDLRVGQRVYAIGNPFGLDQTLTTGIVSALNREIPASNERTIRDVIQTDAAINPGNSGGPLLDSAGRLIGVNTAIFSPSGASAGIGFAIPVDEVNRIVPRLIRDGRFSRPTIGVETAPQGFLTALGLPEGLAVIGIAAGGAAEAAGMHSFRRAPDGRIVVGDVIIGLGKRTVASVDDLYDALERLEPGQVTTIRLRRGREVVELPIRLDPPG
ncbi:MAG: trypsin-like peptidase domain-containing protein [Burkholderiaceae bacterium]